ncbi:MAG: zinc ribbon domain-containing protein [Azoarcus sp.]|jgi:putative FmdB family regulatory protein|nr:zinc ribbon domain-containing protein [Azoarcus sp.]
MPIYEYRCGDCGFQKEHLQKMSEAALASCPSCGGSHYVKQISAAGFQLKGSGWYATDFKNGKAKSAPAPAPAAASGTPPCCANCACHHSP